MIGEMPTGVQLLPRNPGHTPHHMAYYFDDPSLFLTDPAYPDVWDFSLLGRLVGYTRLDLRFDTRMYMVFERLSAAKIDLKSLKAALAAYAGTAISIQLTLATPLAPGKQGDNREDYEEDLAILINPWGLNGVGEANLQIELATSDFMGHPDNRDDPWRAIYERFGLRTTSGHYSANPVTVLDSLVYHREALHGYDTITVVKPHGANGVRLSHHYIHDSVPLTAEAGSPDKQSDEKE